ncbi:uncharacterized protein LOC107484479 isoform X5 [Arachis duranensis]|uniref:Uncharacterized protein LOC107484479 isoform X5 n=1 Tax=Arachis duranensis TaxID=130453 RepID=A0A9C6TT46_ARADU|nr:uncharacterized protein LOC107484479 isoform X5 [Arachis duranensis]
MIMISLRKCDPQTSRAKTLTAKWKLCPKGKNEPSKELPKFSVKLFLHSSGHVAAKFQYDQAMFHGRLWMFPLSSLSEAEKVLGEISNYKVQAGCKFLIFAHHQPMIDAIHECLLKKKVGCIWIDGGTPAASRQQLVTDFQEKDYIKAAVLSIKAGGVGLTLTAASTVIFTEQSWTPGDLIQAKDRAYRIGQVFSHSLSRKERVVTSCMTTLRKQIISNEKNSHI